jgi:hypothetical protein
MINRFHKQQALNETLSRGILPKLIQVFIKPGITEKEKALIRTSSSGLTSL